MIVLRALLGKSVGESREIGRCERSSLTDKIGIGYDRTRYVTGRSRVVSARIGGHSDWRTMIRAIAWLVIAQKLIAARIPMAYSASLAMLLIISALVKTSHRLQKQ
jgi:hypothetical protein